MDTDNDKKRGRYEKKTSEPDFLTPEEREKEIDHIEYSVDEWKGFTELKCPWVIVVREHWRDHREKDRSNARLDGTNEVVFRFYTFQEATAKNWFRLIPDFIARSYPFSENYYTATLYHRRVRVDMLCLKGGKNYVSRRQEAENEFAIRLDGCKRDVTGGAGDSESSAIKDDKQQSKKP